MDLLTPVNDWMESNALLGAVFAGLCTAVMVGLAKAVFRLPSSGRKSGQRAAQSLLPVSPGRSSHVLDFLVFRRIFAFIIDYVAPLIWLFATSVVLMFGLATFEYLTNSELPAAVGVFPSILIIPFWAWNIAARRARSGQSIGHQVAAIALVSNDGNSYVSTARCVVRNVAWTGVVLCTCTAWIYIEVIYLLFGSRGQTLFDRIMRVRVIRV